MFNVGQIQNGLAYVSVSKLTVGRRDKVLRWFLEVICFHWECCPIMKLQLVKPIFKPDKLIIRTTTNSVYSFSLN